MSAEQATSFSETYELASGATIAFCPDKHLPPDIISEELGYQAAYMIGYIRHQAADPDKLVRVL